MTWHAKDEEGGWRVISPEEAVRIQSQYPQATRESLLKVLEPQMRFASPEEAWRLSRLVDDLLAERGDGPTPVDSDWDAIASAFWSWTDRPGNAGANPPKDEMIAEAGMGRERFDAALRRHAVPDARRLAAHLRAKGRPKG